MGVGGFESSSSLHLLGLGLGLDQPLMGDEDTEYFSDGEDEPKSRASCTAATEIIGPVSTSSELNSPGGGVDGGGVDGLTKARGSWRVSYNTFNMKQDEEKIKHTFHRLFHLCIGLVDLLVLACGFGSTMGSGLRGETTRFVSAGGSILSPSLAFFLSLRIFLEPNALDSHLDNKYVCRRAYPAPPSCLNP